MASALLRMPRALAVSIVNGGDCLFAGDGSGSLVSSAAIPSSFLLSVWLGGFVFEAGASQFLPVLLLGLRKEYIVV